MRRRTLAALGGVAVACGAGAAALGRVDRFHPCVVWAARAAGRCGTVRVYEDRDRAAGGRAPGRRIGIRVQVLPAPGGGPSGEPIVFLNGGPGGSSVDAAGYAVDALGALRRRHALVFVDQRGAGGAGALDCDLAGDALQPHVDPMFPAGAVRRCRDALAARADVRQYTTARAADDLAGVLDALGVRRASLFGVSYGGRLALAFLRRHPDRVASVVAASAPPPERAVPLAAGWAGARAFAARAAECRADAACRRDAPDPDGDVRRVLGTLAARPARVARWNWRTLRRETVVVTPRAFAEVSWRMLYDGGRARGLFALAHQAARGRWDVWVDAAAGRGRWREHGSSRGLTLAVLCTEDAPRVAAALARADALPGAARLEPAPLGLPVARELVAACAEWPRGRVAPEDTLPVRSAAPVLFLSGALDPVVPPEWADSARAFLPGSVHLVAPGAGHGAVDDCTRAAIARFVDSGATATVRTPCLAAWRVEGADTALLAPAVRRR